MSVSALLATILLAASPLQQASHDLSVDTLYMFRGPGAIAGTQSLFIIDGERLRWFEADAIDVLHARSIPKNVIAVDVAEADGVPGREAIVMHARGVTLLSIDTEVEPRELAEFDPPLRPTGHIANAAMVVTHEDAPAVLVYRGDKVELVRASGEVADSVALDALSPERFGHRMDLQAIGDEEIHVHASRTIRYSFPGTAQEDAEVTDGNSWPQDLAHLYYDFVDRDLETTRAYFAPDFDRGNSEIFIARHDAKDAPAAARFRGWPAIAFGLADVNGDNAGDLLMWSTRIPGNGVGAITRAAAARTWTATIAIHPFSLEQGRFEARPTSRTTVDLPIGWFLTMDRNGPFKMPSAADLDNDGKADLGFARGEDQYGLWLSSERDVLLGPVHTLPITPPLHDAWTFERADQGDILVLHCGDGIHFVQHKSP